MFRGRHEYTIDGKGRVAIPSKFRAVITQLYGAQPLMVTTLNECLAAYPMREWSQIEQLALQMPSSSPEARLFRRHFLGPAQECALDRQGRILIPPTHREHAALERDVVFIGMQNIFEIWSKDRYQQDRNRHSGDIEGVMAKLERFGI